MLQSSLLAVTGAADRHDPIGQAARRVGEHLADAGVRLTIATDCEDAMAVVRSDSSLQAIMADWDMDDGADMTYFVTNGSSTSNRVCFMANVVAGDRVLLDRNCHKSVEQARALGRPHPLGRGLVRLRPLQLALRGPLRHAPGRAGRRRADPVRHPVDPQAAGRPVAGVDAARAPGPHRRRAPLSNALVWTYGPYLLVLEGEKDADDYDKLVRALEDVGVK